VAVASEPAIVGKFHCFFKENALKPSPFSSSHSLSHRPQFVGSGSAAQPNAARKAASAASRRWKRAAMGVFLLTAARPAAQPVSSSAAVPSWLQGWTMREARAQTPAAQAAGLIGEAFSLAEREAGEGNSSARLNAVRGAASLLPQLEGADRDQLTARWQSMAFASGVARDFRLRAFSDFFDSASHRDAAFARGVAMALPDAAARAGGLLALSERAELSDWRVANTYAMQAAQAARGESSRPYRARALTFVARRMASLNPELRAAALIEASSQVRLLSDVRTRDFLLTEVVGAAGQFDLGLARRIAGTIVDEKLKALAVGRTNLSEISQTSLGKTNAERVSALVASTVRYDVRALPILVQLPPQPDVFRAISNALPPLYATARPGVDRSILEQVWNFAAKAEPSVYRDQLQSRLARTMVLHDLWRGRDWGKQLSWKGGRIQVGAFLKQVMEARSSRLQAEPLQDLASRSLSRALVSARALPPTPRVEALLLIAGQILG